MQDANFKLRIEDMQHAAVDQRRRDLFFTLCVLCVLCGDFCCDSLLCAAAEVVSVDGARFDGKLVGVDANGNFEFRESSSTNNAATHSYTGETRTLSSDALVRWGHFAPPRAQWFVLLDDGSRLVAAAAWAGGAPVKLVNNQFVVKSDLLNDVRLPQPLVQGLVFSERSHPDSRRKLEEKVRKPGEPQDILYLSNGDRISGRVAEITTGTLTISTAAGEAKLPLSRVEAVRFVGPQRPGEPQRLAGKAQFEVELRDGSALRAAMLRGDNQSLDIRLAGGDVRLSGGTIDDVVAVQSLGGDRFVYLSDLAPVEYHHVPYLSLEWPYERDRNVRGGPLSAGGERYWKGIGMHSAARLTCRLDSKWQCLAADIAVDDAAGGRGSVVFGVHLERDGKLQTVFTSDVIRGGEAAKPISVDVSGAQSVTLTVDYADRGDELDYADWLDARLVKYAAEQWSRSAEE